MDKEIKAKVDEFLKNYDVQKLSKDDLDNVSGGTKECPVDYIYRGLTCIQAGDILQGIVDAFGMDVAINWANENWGKTHDWENFMMESKGCNPGRYAAHRIWGLHYHGGY